MKLKSLILGAAGMFAVTGAQAADLPPAPEPVDYVRVCDAFGSGFFYIPGTDSCLRLRGRLRTEARYRSEKSNSIYDALPTPAGVRRLSVVGASAGRRNTSPFFMRARGYWGWDHRTNTDIGLVRAFFRGYIDRDTQDSNGTSLNLDFAFIQIGGLTVGYSDLIIEPVYLSYTLIHNWSVPGMDEETVLAQYVYSFGNGFSVGAVIFDPTAGSFGSNPRSNFLAGSGAAGTEYGGVRMPNVGGALTYDGSIGTFRLSGFVQDVRPNNPAGPALIGSDHDIGWGVGFSGDIGVPLGTNTRIGFNSQYADGAISFVNADLPSYGADFSVNGVGSTTTTRAWSVGAGLTTQVAERLTFNLGGGYTRASNSNVTGLAGFGIGQTGLDFTNSGTASPWRSVAIIDASANLQYRMTSNLVITGEASYRDVNINSTNGTTRIKGNSAFSTILRAQLDF